MRFFLLILFLISGSQAWSSADLPDSTAGVSMQSHWGERPVRADSTTAHFAEQPKPGWEKAVLVPYHILGIPFRIVDHAGHETIKMMDRWGIFDMPPSEHVGLPLPYGVYLLPSISISGLEGFSYALNFRRPDFFGQGNMAFMTVSSSSRHSDKLAGGTYFNMGDRLGLQLGAGYSELPLTRYYGLGYRSSAGDKSYYNRMSRWGGAELDFYLGRQLTLEFRTNYSTIEARDSRYEMDEGLSVVHEGNLPYGFPGESNGWTFRSVLVRDATIIDGRPQDHGFQKASISFFQSTDKTDLSFIQYSFDVQHFFPLWYTERTLGLRSFFTRMHNMGTDDIPLTRMTTMYHPNSLRGFSDLRFYGEGNLGLSAEYRWPIWATKNRKGFGIDAYVFSDSGQVFDRTSEIAINHLEFSAGFGVRLINNDGDFLGRFELGFSDEETVVTLTFSQSFQHHERGLLYGKDPTRRP